MQFCCLHLKKSIYITIFPFSHIFHAPPFYFKSMVRQVMPLQIFSFSFINFFFFFFFFLGGSNLCLFHYSLLCPTTGH